MEKKIIINKIYKYQNFNVRVIGRIYNPCYKVTDLLKILNYSDDIQILLDLGLNSFKSRLSTINNLGNLNLKFSESEGKEIYIDDLGLNRLLYILQEDKKRIHTFALFDFMLNIRKLLYNDLFQDLNIMYSNHKVLNTLISQNTHILQILYNCQFTSIETKNSIEDIKTDLVEIKNNIF